MNRENSLIKHQQVCDTLNVTVQTSYFQFYISKVAAKSLSIGYINHKDTMAEHILLHDPS